MSATATDLELQGKRGRIAIRAWSGEDPAFVLLLAHGYGEHGGRYGHVAERLVAAGAAVYAPDHHGHGRSDGERALVDDVEGIVDDLHAVADLARSERPGLPVALVGHSLGGIIATRFAQRHGDELGALVLSGPVIGGNPAFEPLLGLDEIPEIPIDPAVLSRDPAVGEAYMADELVYHGGFAKPTLESIFAAVETIGEGGTLTVPTLWLHGEEDQLAPYAATQPAIERIRGDVVREKAYPGAQHEIFNETNSDEVLDDVVAFLAETVPGARR